MEDSRMAARSIPLVLLAALGMVAPFGPRPSADRERTDLMIRTGVRLLAFASIALLAAPAAAPADPPPCTGGCPLVYAALELNIDPGHDGTVTRYEVVREGDARSALLTTWPARIDHSRPDGLVPAEEAVEESTPVERSAAAVDRFLRDLAEHDVCTLESPEPHFGLHPTMITLSVRDACGHQQTVRWVTERCKVPDGTYCPGKPYDVLLEDFESFFDEGPGDEGAAR
jgi:hypothetical protein